MKTCPNTTGCLFYRLVYKSILFVDGGYGRQFGKFSLVFGDNLKSEMFKKVGLITGQKHFGKFFGWVSLLWAIISAGNAGKDGHPHKEVTDRLARLSSNIENGRKGQLSSKATVKNFSKIISFPV